MVLLSQRSLKIFNILVVVVCFSINSVSGDVRLLVKNNSTNSKVYEYLIKPTINEIINSDIRSDVSFQKKSLLRKTLLDNDYLKSLHFGDIVTELSITTKPLNITQTGNSTNSKNVVDWFFGIVGIRPPDQQTTIGVENHKPPENCPPCTCGLAIKHKRIVGGVETLVNEYPWMTALMYNNRFYCGASLINNKYLLTAAHCISGFTKDRLSAVFLDHDRSNMYETQIVTRKIRNIYKHVGYNKGGSYNNDIALLQLDEEVPVNGVLKPVCLPTIGKSYTGYEGVAVGWGATEEHGQISSRLREVNVPIMSNIDCKKSGYNSRITDNMLCAGFPDGKKDSCQGDSGGPLHIINGSYHFLVGITSWGEGCAQPNYPGVYTRVNRYVSWIKSNTRDACYC